MKLATYNVNSVNARLPVLLRWLGETQPEAVDAAIRFFTRMGPFRFDAWHPSGAQRAAKILSCLPDSAGPTDMSDSSHPPHNSVGGSTLAAAPTDILPN